MIKITRIAEPDILRNNRANWLINYINAIENYEIDPSPANKAIKENNEKKYNHADIRSALREMSDSKCMYCESHITHIGYPHIEHFRPKSKYPRLCFSWTNLLLACSVCNGKEYKGEKFPSKKQNGLFINPTIENPNIFFHFEFDYLTGVSIVNPLNERAKTTEKELGLNRAELLKHRNSVVKKMVYIAEQAKRGDQEARNLLFDCTKSTEEYSAFAIALFATI